MDVIVLGVYNKQDIPIIEEIGSVNGLKVVWNYHQYNIEAEKGINELMKYYKLYQIGVLIENNFINGDTFYSEPIINEVSDYYIATEWENKSLNPPRLFSFFDALNSSSIKKLIIAFADEWSENTAVKIEKIEHSELKNRLYSPFVWCFGYRNLRTNSEIRDEFHPLVLELEKTN